MQNIGTIPSLLLRRKECDSKNARPTAKHAAGKSATAGVIALESYQTNRYARIQLGLMYISQLWSPPTPPSAGTERAFGRGLTKELFMMSHGAGNFMRASLLLLHIVCGGFEWLECPRGWGFENRNLQIPTLCPHWRAGTGVGDH